MRTVVLPQLIGAWKLVFLNTTSYSYTNALGRITFTDEGYMNAMITDTDVAKPLPNGTTWGKATDAQLGAIARPMVAYSGPYRIEEDAGKYYSHVAVEVSMDPSWIGTDQVRHAVFGEKNGTAQLSLFPFVNGVETTSVLVWEKLD